MSNHTRRPLTELFWRHVDKSEKCWIWLGGTITSRGGVGGVEGQLYGAWGAKHRGFPQTTAHRAAWILTYGPINDDDLVVCHFCDNTLCVRPDHLFIGTQSDNKMDASRKGRLVGIGSKPGSKNGFSKLHEDDIPVIRNRITNGESNTSIATDFSVSNATIWWIRKGLRWQHVP